MDEVDFTVLAATSVFGDLTEKCPPAEACREAFDRTAKATIKMANSKGGFGRMPPLQTNQLPAPAPPSDQWSDYARSDTSPILSRRAMEAQQPSTQFAASPAATVYSGATAAMQDIPRSQMHPDMPIDVKSEPDGASETAGSASDATAIDPSLLPPAPAMPRQTASPAVNSLLNAPPTPTGLSGYLASQPGGMATALTPANLNFAELQGMDFLQSLSTAGNAAGSSGDVNGDTQMDIGFGLGWEGLHHDFSDGQQVDLFDGFFFGGQQGGAGGTGI
jgi:hypothetical protein